MKKVCGLIIFWTGAGMAIMVFAPVNICTIAVIFACLIGGYNCFCS